MRFRHVFHVLLLCLCLTSPARLTAAETATLPNVVLIYIDDQGYSDLGCYGSTVNMTPNIDRLAVDGVRFTDFYSAYCVCSASRASLMTGCYQPRINMPGVLGPHSATGLHPDEVTIADMLKTKGYATMCIGKWHLGDSRETLPTAQGFDSYFGYPYSNDMARKNKANKNDPASLDRAWRDKAIDDYNGELYRDTEVIEQPVDQTTLTDRYTDEALKFVRANKSRPFFLYLAHTMVHVPLFVSDDRYDPDPAKAYKLTVEHIDDSVGAIARALSELGLHDNTIVVYSSDNGPWLSKKHHAGIATPLRAGKATTFEGGMRVPGIIRWPARIAGGRTCSEVAATIDMLPTLASIVGAELPKDRPIDGHDITALLDDANARSPYRQTGYFYYRNGKVEAVRRGKWKLRVAGKTPELYDLAADISESTDVAAANTDVVRSLQALIMQYDADLKANSRPLWRDPNRPASKKKGQRKAK